MSDESVALTVIGSGALSAPTPQRFVSAASLMATALKSVVDGQKLYANIQGKKYVTVEGWTTLASMLGVFPCEVSNEEKDGVYVSVVELRKADGSVVGRASAECGGEADRVWGSRDAYARRSMAATRATSKACRLSFSWIMTLAGYSSTPAEEMDFAKEPAKPQTAQPKGPWDGAMQVTFGKFKGKRFSELPNEYIAWAIENMKPPVQDYARLESQRRLKAETAPTPEPDIVDASWEREPWRRGESDEQLYQNHADSRR